MNRPLTRVDLRGKSVEIKSRSIGPTKHPSQSKTPLGLNAKARVKSRLENSLSVTTVGRHRVTQKKSVVQFSLSISAENVATEGQVPRKCLSKPQNVNALDDSVSDDEQETYHLFTLDTL